MKKMIIGEFLDLEGDFRPPVAERLVQPQFEPGSVGGSLLAKTKGLVAEFLQDLDTPGACGWHTGFDVRLAEGQGFSRRHNSSPDRNRREHNLPRAGKFRESPENENDDQVFLHTVVFFSISSTAPTMLLSRPAA